MEKRHCKNCDAVVGDRDKHCGNCGRPLAVSGEGADVRGKPVSKPVAQTVFGYKGPGPGEAESDVSSKPGIPQPVENFDTTPVASPDFLNDPVLASQGSGVGPTGSGARNSSEHSSEDEPSASISKRISSIDPLGSIAMRLPQSKPGTLFGIPLSTLRDGAFEKRALYFCGVALLLVALLPWNVKPWVFGWSEYAPTFEFFVLPILVGGAYLLIASAPRRFKEQIPPVILKWLPFAASFLALVIVGIGGFMTFGVGSSGYGLGARVALSWGIPLLVFGLLVRLNDPNDRYARYVIGAGALLSAVFLLSNIDVFFSFKAMSAAMVAHNILTFVVLLVATACIALVVLPGKVPLLASIDQFAPIMTAILLAYPILSSLVYITDGMIAGRTVDAILSGVHVLIFNIAYFGILLITSPEAYDELKAVVVRNQAAAQAAYREDIRRQTTGHDAKAKDPQQGQTSDRQPWL